MERAKQLIEEFCLDEYGCSADCSDPTNIGLAYTIFYDEEKGSEYGIQASVDLVNNCIFFEVNGKIIANRKYNSIDELIEKELNHLNFDDLVTVPDEYWEGKRR